MNAPRKTIDLSLLTPRAFEEFTAKLYDALGYDAELMPLTGDEGRDVIARSPTQWVVIECKHSLGGTVGRPVIQKLHSALMTLKAPIGMNRRGAVVTSGGFSRAAKEYVAAEGLPIDLIDFDRLLATVRGVGWNLTDPSVPAASYVPLLPSSEVESAVRLALDRRVLVNPGKARDYLRTVELAPAFRALYRVAYSYEKEARSPSGLPLGWLQGNASVWIDADTGERVREPAVEACYRSGPVIGDSRDWPTVALSGSQIATMVAADAALEATQTFSYVGANNQSYTHTCEFRASEVSIDFLQLIFVPEYRASLVVGASPVSVAFYRHGESISPVRGLKRRAMLCASCKRLGVRGRPSMGIGSPDHCRKCRATTCRSCATRIRSWLIRLDIYCDRHATPRVRAEAAMENAGAAVIGLALILLLVAIF